MTTSTILYLQPDSGEIKTRETVLAEYMGDLVCDLAVAEQALDDAVERGLLVSADSCVLELDWGAGPEGHELPFRTTLAAFLADNAEIADSPEISQVRLLAVGESCTIGGGAFALCTVTRMPL
jgi:hypothetical protein